MATRTVWTCDGCDRETVYSTGHSTDWKVIEITIEGFSGYPLGPWANSEGKYHLCPQCQIKLHDTALPVNWPRGETEAKP